MTRLHIIIPAYNAERYIKDALDSIKEQKVASLLITVIDNCSTDGTVKVVNNYTDLDINIIRNPVNIGAIANHNLALSVANAEFVKLLSADDVLLPGSINKQIAALDKNPDCVLSSCNFIATDSNLKPVGQGQYLSGYRLGSTAIDYSLAKPSNLVGCPSAVMFRRSASSNLKFDGSFPWMGDVLFYCSILQNGNFINIDEDGFLYRTHPLSDSILGCTPWIRLKDELRVLLKFKRFKGKHIILLASRFFENSLRYVYRSLQRIKNGDFESKNKANL